MKVVDLTREHLQKIKLRKLELEDHGVDDIGAEDTWFIRSNYKKAIIVDDEVVAVMGGLIEEHTCQTWLLASELMYKFPITTMKLVQRLHKEAVRDHGVSIFFTYNLPSFEREVKFVESLGYKKRETYSHFDDGKDRILLAMEVL